MELGGVSPRRQQEGPRQEASEGLIAHRHSDNRWKVRACGLIMILLLIGAVLADIIRTEAGSKDTTTPTPTVRRSALVIMNVQEDYVREFVPGGEAVVPVINAMRDEYAFDEIVILKEWHCEDHISFASFHANRTNTVGDPWREGDRLTLRYLPDGRVCDDTADGAFLAAYGANATYGPYTPTADAPTSPRVEDADYVACALHGIEVLQTLWADHCVMNTPGAELLPALRVEPADVEVRSGYVCHVDSPEDDGMEMMDGHESVDFAPPFDLWPALRARGITDVYFSGTALAFLVKPSKDTAANGFATHVVRDAAPFDEARLPALLQTFEQNGVGVVLSGDIALPKRHEILA